MTKAYLSHINSGADLQTTYAAIRAGFVSLALERNRRATPFVAQARALKAEASKAKTPKDLIKMYSIRPALLTAAGISDKAKNHLQDGDKTQAIAELIRNFLEPSGADFVEELVFRFLLTRGDTLGGSMRNVGGFLAQCKLSRFILARLKVAGRQALWFHAETKKWLKVPSNDAGIEYQLKGLAWQTKGKTRTLVYNLTVPIVKNNIDLCLFDAKPTGVKLPISSPSSYLALGELKGGIDPSGADEHWKTARTALERISKSFSKHNATPLRFFVGAAIEARMADEIWQMLRNGTLDNAANLTSDTQMVSITEWLCDL